MKYLKNSVFIIALMISNNGYSAFKVCGQQTQSSGYVQMSCHMFEIGGCNDEKNLATFGWYYPGGWTCKDFGNVVGDDGSAQLSRSKDSRVADDGKLHLIRSKDGSAYVMENGEKAQIRSDAHVEFIKKIEQETANGRVNIETIHNQINNFLATDNGYVSDSRMEVLSSELGVPIESENSPSTRIESSKYQSKGSTMAAQTSRPPSQSPQICVAEYESASGVGVFFRNDRRVTGVWKAKPGPGTKFQKPDVIIADANGCLYGGTGNTWQPLDCPGRDFSNPGTYPMNFKIAASCSSSNTTGLEWYRLNEGRGGATGAPQNLPSSRFALVQQISRPMERQDPGGGATTRQVYCWVDENPNGMFPKIKCCEFTFEELPHDHNTMKPMKVEDCSMSLRVPTMPDVQNGSIVIRTANGTDYCLNPNGSFGACAIDHGIKEKGIK